ncbi:hypothetical protein [Salibaculum sp.]|uniref:hypothetical protein n=1 Tax=Salibaculum sp. TaxID=2855480 RepID=UPI002B46096B|nr:hypothetical protein [Salibaculum sp.]HKL68456.1 hypothetical protein [Salibaculum sp.]
MTDTTTPCRGAAPVGRLSDLPRPEAATINALREWPGNPDDHAGDDGASHHLSQLFEALDRFGRRPLMRHHVGCSCLGADEACVAQLIGSAGEADREDAMMIACLLVRADMAPMVADIAQMVALHLRRAGGANANPGRQDPTCPARPVLH